MDEQRNWAGNIGYGTSVVRTPTSLEQLQDLVASSAHLRALGSRHSFNEVACTDGELVSLERFPSKVEIADDASEVVVTGAVRYGDLSAELHAAGLALANLGSLPHISVAGACATGTHGSGDANQVLAASVRWVELVTSDGTVTTVCRGDADFGGAVLALGVLGVVTAMALDVQPTFDVRQDVVLGVPMTSMDELDALTGAGYSVSAFADLRSDRFRQVWVKSRPDVASPGPQSLHDLGGRPAQGQLHPLPDLPVDHATEQGVAGPWHQRLPHFRATFTPSNGQELQSEFLVARQHAGAAWREVRAMSEQIAPLLHMCEIRTVAADDLWLSPAHGRDVVGLHFTWRLDWPGVRAVLEPLEARLSRFDARPHWGKLFTAPADRVRSLYPRLPDQVALRDRLDPRGTFSNAFTDRYLGGAR